MTRGCSLVVLVSILGAYAPHARAQGDAGSRTLSVQLFDEAKALAESGRFSEACPKYAESYRLEPQLGALLHLAECYENNGQLASAWGSFREAEELASKRDDPRAELAAEHVRALKPRLSYLVVRVPEASRLRGLELLRDGAPVAAVLWGGRAAVDAGRHRVEARAPGHRPWQQELAIAEEASTATVDVPVLEAEPVVESAVPMPAPKLERDPASRRITARIDGSSEVWDLKLNDGSLLCRLPCSQRVGPSQAVYVADSGSSDRLNLALQGEPGSETRFVVKPSRGSPVLAGITTVALGLIAVIEWAIVISPPKIGADDIREGRTEASTRKASLVIGSIFTLGAGGTGYWWYWSRGSDRAELEAKK